MATPHAPVTFCLWPPDGQLGACGRPALPGLLMMGPRSEVLPFCGDHADDAWREGWTRQEQLCDFDDAGRVGELCGQPAIGVVISPAGIEVWRRRACPAHLTVAEHDGYKIRPLGPWSDAIPSMPAHLAHLPRPWQPGEEIMFGVDLGVSGAPTPITWTRIRPGQPWVASLGSWTIPPPNEDYVTETEGAAMVARHCPVSAAPRPLPRHYTSRPSWFGCGLLAAAVGLTGASWAWCWLRDFVRGLAGPR
jgi:hypothetical protein